MYIYLRVYPSHIIHENYRSYPLQTGYNFVKPPWLAMKPKCYTFKKICVSYWKPLLHFIERVASSILYGFSSFSIAMIQEKALKYSVCVLHLLLVHPCSPSFFSSDSARFWWWATIHSRTTAPTYRWPPFCSCEARNRRNAPGFRGEVWQDMRYQGMVWDDCSVWLVYGYQIYTSSIEQWKFQDPKMEVR